MASGTSEEENKSALADRGRQQRGFEGKPLHLVIPALEGALGRECAELALTLSWYARARRVVQWQRLLREN